MLTTRELPPIEWARLKGTEADHVWRGLDPARSRVIVVEQDGAIIGCHLLTWLLHAECLWIAPDHRGKTSVARRLWARVQQAARELGSRTIVTGAVDDSVRALLAHVGATRLPGEQYVIVLKGAE